MKTIVLNLPDTVDLNDKEVLLLLASMLYEQGKLSLGQAAEMAGLSKQSFLEILSHYGVSVFNYSFKDLDRDVTNARRHHR